MFWKHNYFLLKVKDSQENVLKENFYKKWLFLNVSPQHTFFNSYLQGLESSLKPVFTRWKGHTKGIFYICLNTLVEHFDI